MTFSIEFADEQQEYQARIKVIGCGGSGGNAVNTMINFGLEGVEFIVVNTDAQALNGNAAPTKLNIGGAVTRGLGAGADPERGRKAAMEDHQRIKELISGADMVFICAGMGGGTGTGAAPVIAQLAREEGALTVGVVTKPFLFEGRQRSRRAEIGLAQLTENVDTLITIPNQKLLMLGEEDLSFIDAFRKADEVLFQAVKGISDLITQNGIVNVDFADVKTVMNSMGRALMGTGIAKGNNRARLAAEMAISSPLLDDISVDGDRRAHQHRRRPGPQDARDPGGGEPRPGAGARGCEHHLRREHRRGPRRERQGHRHRDRFRHHRAHGRDGRGHAPLDACGPADGPVDAVHPAGPEPPGPALAAPRLPADALVPAAAAAGDAPGRGRPGLLEPPHPRPFGVARRPGEHPHPDARARDVELPRVRHRLGRPGIPAQGRQLIELTAHS